MSGLAIFPGEADDAFDVAIKGAVVDNGQRFAAGVTLGPPFGESVTCRKLDDKGYALTLFVRSDGADERFNLNASIVAGKRIEGIAVLYDDDKDVTVSEFWKIRKLLAPK